MSRLGIDGRDVVVASGILLVAYGLFTVWVPLACVVVGALLLAPTYIRRAS